MIKEDYVSFEVAKLLKGKEFKGCGSHFYEKGKLVDFRNYWCRITPEERYEAIEAPTLQMAMKWLREVHKIDIDIISRWNLTPEYHICEYRYRLHYNNAPNHDINQKFNTYEEAAGAAVKYCLQNLI